MRTRSTDILWICDRSTEQGGVACALYDLYPSLKRAGVAISFVAPRNARFPNLESQGANIHKVLPRFPGPKGYVWAFLSICSLLRLLIRMRPRVAVADHTNGLLLLLLMKALRLPVKTIYRNHGVEFLLSRPRLAKLFLRRVDEIITVSEPEADALRGILSRDIPVVPNCVPEHCLAATGRIHEKSGNTGPSIAYVGRLTRAKGIYSFLQVIESLRRDLPDLRAIAIGEISTSASRLKERERLLKLMRTAGIDYRGELVRQVIFDDVDFVLVCSRRESFGLTVLEAPFFDVIPIAFESPGTQFLLKTVGECLIRNGRTGEMKDAILKIWRDPVRQTEISESLKSRFRAEYDPARIAIDLTSIFGTREQASNENIPGRRSRSTFHA